MNRFVARPARAVQTLIFALIFAFAATGCRAPQTASNAASPPPSASAAASARPPAVETSPTWGAEDAPVTVVEFGDLECPFTARVAPTLAQVQATYGPSKLRIVWRHSPLPFHKSARAAHEAAVTVLTLAGSRAFFEFSRLALSHQRELTEQAFEGWAVEVGVDRERFVQARKLNADAGLVQSDLSLARQQGVTGTPTFLINGVPLRGAQPFERFQQVIDDELKETDKLVASGVAARDVSALRTQMNFKPPEPAKEPAEREAKPDDTTVWQVPVAADDPVRGSAKALVTIVMWSDFQCPFCARVEPTLGRIRESYGDQVRIVWKDNPLPFHQRAVPAALLGRVAYALRGADTFWKIHDALFESQADLEDDSLKAIAVKFGVDYAKVQKGKLHDQALAKLEQSAEEANERDARGTPHFFINGRRLAGAQPFDKFKELIDAELEKARAVKAGGIAAELVYAELMKSATPPPPPETKDVPPADATSPSRGSAHAKVTIQEFSDFQCPFCKRVGPTLVALEKEFGPDLKRVFRHMPLPFHQQAPLAAEASLEAFAQKGNPGFWAYHDALFEALGGDGLERPNLEAIAQKLGLDLPRFRAALDSRRHEAKVKSDSEVAQKAGISGTPAFAINGYFVSGAQAPAVFRRLIRRALADARAAH
jgi:protein-disulfide isomerase